MVQNNPKPFVWQMIRQAIDDLAGKASMKDIRAYIHQRWDAVNDNTISAQVNVCTVNSPSRIHYPENSKPRVASSQYDFLFKTALGQVEKYDPQRHGQWEIRPAELGKVRVARVDESDDHPVNDPEPLIEPLAEATALLFPLEAHLRDFLARNLSALSLDGQHLSLYVDENQQDGVEFPTGVGPIDILAVDDVGNFVVLELKLSRGPDRALGQLMRYMGWIKTHLAGDRTVSGIIVASQMDEKLKYAASIMPSVRLFEYAVDFKVEPAALA